MSLRLQNKQKARANILNAANALIVKKGLELATTRKIAASAGVSYQTLYNYFPTKADIVLSLLEAELLSWKSASDDVIKHYSGDLIATLTEFIQINLDSINRAGKDLWRFVTVQAFNREISIEALNLYSSIAHEDYYALLNLAHGMGHLKQETDLHLLAHTLYVLADHATGRYILGELDDAHFMVTQRQIIELVTNPYLRSE